MTSNVGMLEEDREDYMYKVVTLQHEKVEAYRQAYLEEEAFREDAEERISRLLKFLKEAGIFHPRGHELNEENERLAREEEEQREQEEEGLKAEEEQREQEEQRTKQEKEQREQEDVRRYERLKIEEERLKAEELQQEQEQRRIREE